MWRVSPSERGRTFPWNFVSGRWERKDRKCVSSPLEEAIESVDVSSNFVLSVTIFSLGGCHSHFVGGRLWLSCSFLPSIPSPIIDKAMISSLSWVSWCHWTIAYSLALRTRGGSFRKRETSAIFLYLLLACLYWSPSSSIATHRTTQLNKTVTYDIRSSSYHHTSTFRYHQHHLNLIHIHLTDSSSW